MNALAMMITLPTVLAPRDRIRFVRDLEHMNMDAKIAHDKIKEKARFKGDSQCLMCGRWHYHEARETCTKCGGRCHIYPADGLEKIGKRDVPV